MTKAELNAHRTFPDVTIIDGYTMTHKREREAFVKGWHKAVELCCDFLRTHSHNYADNALGKEYLVNDFKDYMKGE